MLSSLLSYCRYSQVDQTVPSTQASISKDKTAVTQVSISRLRRASPDWGQRLYQHHSISYNKTTLSVCGKLCSKEQGGKRRRWIETVISIWDARSTYLRLAKIPNSPLSNQKIRLFRCAGFSWVLKTYLLLTHHFTFIMHDWLHLADRYIDACIYQASVCSPVVPESHSMARLLVWSSRVEAVRIPLQLRISYPLSFLPFLLLCFLASLFSWCSKKVFVSRLGRKHLLQLSFREATVWSEKPPRELAEQSNESQTSLWSANHTVRNTQRRAGQEATIAARATAGTANHTVRIAARATADPPIWNHSNRECSGRQTGRQVKNHAGQEPRAYWRKLAGKGETSGDKCEIIRTELRDSWETAGRQGERSGDRCKSEIMRTRALRASRVYWETRGDKGETSVKSCESRAW